MPNYAPRIHDGDTVECGHCENTITRGDICVTAGCGHVLCHVCAGVPMEELEQTEQTASGGSVECPVCGNLVSASDMTGIEIGEYPDVCCDCVTEFPRCNCCSSLFPQDWEYTVMMGGDHRWCDECIEMHACTCAECDDIVPSDTTYPTGYDGAPVCEGCFDDFRACEECGDNYHVENMSYVEEYGSVCEGCFTEDEFDTCEQCGNAFRVHQLHLSDNLEDRVCRTCDPAPDLSAARPIQNYSFKPEPNFQYMVTEANRAKAGLFMCGVETEIEVDRNHNARAVAKTLREEDKVGLFYCKSDSSISYGFEIVTHPFTYDWMLNHREAFEPMFSLRKRFNCRSYNTRTCGMHVHIDRNAFKHRLHLLKFAKMFFINHDFVFRMSRRDPTRFEQYSNDNVRWHEVQHIIKQGGRGGDRWVINLAPPHTVEVRLFRGTLNPRGWYANIEFIKALWDFTSEAGLQDITPRNFSEWSSARARAYPNYIGVLGRLLPTQEGWSGLCV